MRNLPVNIKLWGFVLAMLLVAAVFFTPVSGDAPFYLSTARDIATGFVPYRDINLSYTPLVMYFNALLWKAGAFPAYSLFLSFQYAIILFCGYCLFRIGMISGKLRKTSIFIAFFFIVSILSCDGSYINLEVYSILFVLAAYIALIKQRLFLVGMMLGFSVLCKQYGLLNFIPFILLAYLDLKANVQKMILFFLGALVPATIFILYFCGWAGIPVSDLIMQLTGQGYGEKNIAAPKTVIGFLNGAKILILMMFPLLVLKVRPWKNTRQVILLAGFFLMLIPTAVQQFQHYFLNAFPYAGILLMLNWRDDKRSLPVINIAFFCIAALLGVRIYNYSGKLQIQKTVAASLKKAYPKNSQIYLKGEANYLYVLNNYRNPALKQAGYSYLFQPDAQFLEKYTVLTFDRYPSGKPQQIIAVNGRKIYEY